MLILSLKTFEGVTRQRIVLGILHTTFDFAFVLGRVRFGRNERGAVMLCKRLKLGMDFRIVPVGSIDGSFQIVNHQPLGDSAKIMKRVLDRSDEVVGGLAPDHFAVSFAGMTQDHSQHPRATFSSLSGDDWCAGSKVNLSFLTRINFHSPKRQRRLLSES